MTEKRQEYLRLWRLKNRKKVYQYHKSWRDRKPSNHPRTLPLLGTSGIGRKFELVALQILQGAKDENSINFHGKWDITWNSKKIEVKSCRGNRGGYAFNCKNKVFDYLMCFCLSIDYKIEKIYLIPLEAILNKKGIRIGGTFSKYDKYKISFLNR